MELSITELRAIRNDLIMLHKATAVIGDWAEKQTLTFINVGEYGLALDGIAYAYLDSGKVMPLNEFKIFEKLAIMMDLAQDAEFEGVARLRANFGSTPS